MDYTKDMEQIKRVQDKLARMARREGNLVRLEDRAPRQWLELLVEDECVRLPEDYWEIISQSADGGQVPDVWGVRHWRPLQNIGDREVNLGVPYPPAEDPKALRGGLVRTSDPTRLPGQVLLMGNRALGWSLITAGPCAGEVWTVGRFRMKESRAELLPTAFSDSDMGTYCVRRAPACTFSQWLEMVLDGNLEAYLTFCLTGEGGRFGRSRRLDRVIAEDFTWPDGADPAEQCVRWLENNRFVHQGPGDGWSGYLMSQIRHTLGLLPQERDGKLAARREAQQKPGYPWDNERTREWAHIKELMRVIREAEEKGEPWGSADPDEARLFHKAGELLHSKRFQARGEGVRDLSFLTGLSQLKELDLWDNDIEDLLPIASLTGLRELWLPYNLISDLSPLAGLDKLVQLKVYGNRITSLEPLRGLTNLNVLDLRGNPLESGTLACLRKCKRLGMLDLSNTGLGDISDLEFCRAWNLDLYDNPDLTGLEVISTMKRLSCLYLDTAVARRYDIQALAPQLSEHVELGGISLYVWPEKYFN